MKKYESPKLFVDEYVADTMIASSATGIPKNGQAGHNQNCWGPNETFGKVVGNNACYG